MATWNSTPDVPHTGGTFNFPQNTTNNDIVYTIEYTDDNGCTASTTYLVPSCGFSVYEIGYTLTSTRSGLSAPINYIHGNASIFTQSELSTVIQIEPSYRLLEPSMCEVLDAEVMTLDRLLGLAVGDQLYAHAHGRDLCIASGISITIPDDPTGIWKRIVLKKIG